MSETETQQPQTFKQRADTLLAMFDIERPALEELAIGQLDMTRFRRTLYNALVKTPNVLLCTNKSILLRTRQAVELQLELGSALQHAEILPFKNNGKLEATLVIGYRGFIHIITRDGRFAHVTAEAVCEKDDFDYDSGTAYWIRHKKSTEKDRGELTHAYVIFFKPDRSYQFHVMTAAEIEDIRMKAPAPDSPAWRNHKAQMYVKTAIKQGSKQIPQSVQLSNALKIDNAVEVGELDDAVIDVEGTDIIEENDTAQKVAADLEGKKEPEPGAQTEPGVTSYGTIIARYGISEAGGEKLVSFGKDVMGEVGMLFMHAVSMKIEPARYVEAFDTWPELKASLEKEMAKAKEGIDGKEKGGEV